MWPFRKRQRPDIPDITTEAYARWLRAQRPPWLFFFERSELEQEHLAQLGDLHWQDIAIAIGYATQDPKAAESLLEGNTVDAEVSRAKQFAQNISRMLDRAGESTPPPPPPPVSMGGLGKRRETDFSQHRAPSFMGRSADKEAGTA